MNIIKYNIFLAKKNILEKTIENIVDLKSSCKIWAIIIFTNGNAVKRSHIDVLESHWIKFFLKEQNGLDYIQKESLRIHDIISLWELSIRRAFELKQILGYLNIGDYRIFWNKELQRKKLNKSKEFTVKSYWISTFWELDALVNDLKFFPYVLKPSHGSWSVWVVVVHTLDQLQLEAKDFFESNLEVYKNKGYQTQSLIIEEFIDWKLFSIDYYITDKWKIYYSYPVLCELLKDLIQNDDYGLMFQTIQNFDCLFKDWLIDFLVDTINTIWIKNTFIHHEFKYDWWKFRTIEINGRIWWYREKLYYIAFGKNLLTLGHVSKSKYIPSWITTVVKFFPKYSNKKFLWYSGLNLLIQKYTKNVAYLSLKRKEWELIWKSIDWYYPFWYWIRKFDIDEDFEEFRSILIEYIKQWNFFLDD